MQRKATKNTRTANAAEKRYLLWVKEQPCVICGNWPVIADHCEGATYKHNKVLIGMWFILPYCQIHDAVKTNGSKRAHLNEFGKTQAELWMEFHTGYNEEIPNDVVNAIGDLA